MKKIAITTSISVYNYGTKLQAFAMNEIFKQRGFDSIILEYTNYKDSYLCWKIKMILRKFLKSIIIGKKHELIARYNYEYNIKDKKFLNNIIHRYMAIDFCDSQIPHKRYVGTHKALSKYGKQFDVTVTGSDQVWHPILNKNNLWYLTLNFTSKGTRRIAYAPSLGVDILTEKQNEIFRTLLKNMDYISLREDSGVKAIQPLVNKPVSLVLDPTLLVGRKLWDTVIDETKAKTKGNYCLCYLLGTNPEHRKICEDIAKKMDVKILNFAHFKAYNDADENMSGEKLYDITPFEFVGLIKNAKFVITDSFHCSAFAIQYQLPFLSLLRFQSTDKMSTNTRLYSMLEQFGVANRIYIPGKNAVSDIIAGKIDYDYVESQLALKRKESSDYLDNALEGI